MLSFLTCKISKECFIDFNLSPSECWYEQKLKTYGLSVQMVPLRDAYSLNKFKSKENDVLRAVLISWCSFIWKCPYALLWNDLIYQINPCFYYLNFFIVANSAARFFAIWATFKQLAANILLWWLHNLGILGFLR